MGWADVEFVTATTLTAADLNQLDDNAALLHGGAIHVNVCGMDWHPRTIWDLDAADAPQDGANVTFVVDIGGFVQVTCPTVTFGGGVGQTSWGGATAIPAEIELRNINIRHLPHSTLHRIQVSATGFHRPGAGESDLGVFADFRYYHPLSLLGTNGVSYMDIWFNVTADKNKGPWGTFSPAFYNCPHDFDTAKFTWTVIMSQLTVSAHKEYMT